MFPDELDRQRQAERAGVEGQRDAGRAQQGPEAIEDRVAGAAEAVNGKTEQQAVIAYLQGLGLLLKNVR